MSTSDEKPVAGVGERLKKIMESHSFKEKAEIFRDLMEMIAELQGQNSSLRSRLQRAVEALEEAHEVIVSEYGETHWRCEQSKAALAELSKEPL